MREKGWYVADLRRRKRAKPDRRMAVYWDGAGWHQDSEADGEPLKEYLVTDPLRIVPARGTYPETRRRRNGWWEGDGTMGYFAGVAYVQEDMALYWHDGYWYVSSHPEERRDEDVILDREFKAGHFLGEDPSPCA